MKLLLDECVARGLKRDLVGHDAMTVVEAGYSGMKNGALLRAASGNFEVLLTVDRNLPRQQNISSLQIAVIVLVAEGITYADLKPLVPDVHAQLNSIQPGEIIHVGVGDI